MSSRKISGRLLTMENGLPDNNVRCVAVDDAGFVWISTLHNLYRYDGFRFIQFNIAGTDSKSNRIERLTNAGHNLLQIKMSDEKDRFLNTETLSFNDNPTERKAKQTRPLEKDFFADSRGNLVRFDKETGEIHIPMFGQRDSLCLKVVNEEMLRLHNDFKITVMRASDSTIWVSTNGNGVFMHDRTRQKTIHITKAGYPSFMASDYVVNMASDMAGGVWVVFNRAGIARIELDENDIRTLPMTPGEAQNHSNEIKLLKRLPDGRIIVANDAGSIGKIDYIHNKVTPVKDFPDGLDYLDAGISPSGFAWIATRNHGLMLNNCWYVNDDEDYATIGGNRVDAVAEDAAGHIWIGGTGFLDCIDASDAGKANIKFRHLMNEGNRSNVRQLLLDQHGNMWGATDDGLIVWNPDSLLSTRVSAPGELGFIKILDKVRINALHEDAAGRLWIGTDNAGLYCVENIPERLAPETLQPGKAEWYSSKAYIQSVASNSNGALWISTDNGLFLYRRGLFSPSLLRFDNASERNIYQRGCVAETEDGSMAFGTGDGIVIVDENDVKSFDRPVSLHVSDVVGGNRSLLSRLNVSEDANVYQLKLDETECPVTIYLTDLTFGKASRFCYKMEGRDSVWTVTDDQPFVSFDDLSAGHHTLLVRAISPGGDFVEKRVEITVASSSVAATKVVAAICVAIFLLVVLFVAKRRGSKRTEASPERTPAPLPLPALDTSEYDREFVASLNKFIEEHMVESDLGVERMAKAMNYGRTKFYEKVNDLLGCSPKEYLRKRRMERAAELLKDDRITVAEVAYKVGFGTPQYLTTVFKQTYGISPSQYRKQGGLAPSENIR